LSGIDENEYWGAYTDGEREAGIPFLAGGGDEEYDLGPKEFETHLKLRRELLKSISHLNSIEKVRDRTLRKLFDSGVDKALLEYMADEGLNYENVTLAKQNNALPILLRNSILSILKINLSRTLFDEVNEFCHSIYVNECNEIVYLRVRGVQKYLHELAVKMRGTGAEQDLPSEEMRILLSTVRLHLNFIDLKCRQSQYVKEILSKTSAEELNSQLNIEKKLSEITDAKLSPFIPARKSYIRNWRRAHYQSLLAYFDESIANKIVAIINLNCQGEDYCYDTPLSSFKERALDIYSGLEPVNKKVGRTPYPRSYYR